MSTRSFVGAPTEHGVVGRYVHYDGKPESMLPTLEAITERDGFQAAADMLLSREGWSYLDTANTTNSLGEDRAVLVDGYGLAYLTLEDSTFLRLEETEHPYAYVIDPQFNEIYCWNLGSNAGRAAADAYAAHYPH